MSSKILNRKTTRNYNESNKIKLTIDKNTVNFDSITTKLNYSKELYEKYMNTLSKDEKWELINQIIDYNEIDPNFNYEFLKLNEHYKKDYEYNFNQLSPTLTEKDYLALTKKEQQNPTKILFDLLNLCLSNEKDFDVKTKKININKYNIPLIEGNERIRINYYIQIFSHYQIYLKENNQNKNCDTKSLQIKYNNIKKGIKFFSKIIPQMENIFKNINLDETSFNIKIFIFILYITIINEVSANKLQSNTILYFFLKEIEQTKDLIEYNSLDNIIQLEYFYEFPSDYGIKKKYNNEEIDINDNEKDKKMYEFIIFNKFESINFDGRNYLMKNLINEYKENPYIPLNILLCRNQSLSYFIKNNENFLNVNDNIYNKFKEYFKIFLRSTCVKQALKENNNYNNIIEIIDNDNILNKFLNDKYLKSIPLFEFAGSGYTNKDILISFVSGFPFMVYKINIPDTSEEYDTLKAIIVIFNIAMKMITTLHEFIVHFLFGYLNYLSEGIISYESPKKDKKIELNDGGLYFENILFGKIYGNLILNDVLTILNIDSFISKDEFQKNLRKKLDLDKFQVKSDFLRFILNEYNINLKTLKVNPKMYSYMKSDNTGMYIKRDINNILLPFKMP
jgi:hypothetical protein